MLTETERLAELLATSEREKAELLARIEALQKELKNNEGQQGNSSGPHNSPPRTINGGDGERGEISSPSSGGGVERGEIGSPASIGGGIAISPLSVDEGRFNWTLGSYGSYILLSYMLSISF